MSDYLINIGANPMARKAIKQLGLPVPLPQKLARGKGPLEQHPLKDELVVVCHGPSSRLAPTLACILPKAGANVLLPDNREFLEIYRQEGEAWGRVPSFETNEKMQPRALIFDATGLEKPAELRTLYDFFHQWIRKIKPCGRVLVLRTSEINNPQAAATNQALEGFVRSLSREIGRKGSVAQLVTVDSNAHNRLEGVLRFLLSKRSAFISGQPFNVSAIVRNSDHQPVVRALDQKVALVTGAARGIGASIAQCLAREGAQVICMDRPSEADAASILAEKIGGTMLLCDITDPQASLKTKTLLDEKFGGGIDIIVHNAGITRDKTLARMKPEAWDLPLDVNLISLINLNEQLLPAMGENGRVVCISSMGGISGNTGQTNYAASKAGVIGYVKAAAGDLADRGITLNAVAPGLIETKMTAAMPKGVREVGRRLSNLLQGGLPVDVAELVTFLASPNASGMTGQTIRICGGNYLGA